MATKQYSIGYEEGFQNGWNAAVDAKPEQPAQHPKTKAIAECLAVLRPSVKGKFPHEQALEELVGYIAAQQSAQQEPATVVQSVPMGHGHRDMHYAICDHLPVGTNLYTFPQPAQRTWVGLTDEEIDETHETKVWDARRSYARAIEAKLKEKNT